MDGGVYREEVLLFMKGTIEMMWLSIASTKEGYTLQKTNTDTIKNSSFIH